MEKETTYNQAKLWQIGAFAFNNTASNAYNFFFMYIAYYMTGFIALATVAATTFITSMRVFDAVTDPFIGLLVDRTSTRFGKNRPFMLLGNVIMLVASGIMFFVVIQFPMALRFPAFIVVYLCYVIGYTFQNLVTKSAQTCLTNDPKQRPLFTIFDCIYSMILTVGIKMLFSNNLIPKYGGFTAEVFQEAWMVLGIASLIMTIVAIIGIAKKDVPENYGLGSASKAQKIGFKDYWDVLKNNRAIQMLVVSASTDKLAKSCYTNATVGVVVFGIICGNYALDGAASAYTSVPSIIFCILGVLGIASRMGQKKAMMVGTWGALACCSLSVVLFLFGDPTTMIFPGMEGFNGWNFFTLAYLILWIGFQGFQMVSGNIVIPMTADCSDYEVYRSGRYVPGIISTLFSFVDKLISSLSTTIIGIICAVIGFTETLPTVDTPLTPSLKFAGIFMQYGLTIIGLICNIIAMKLYPLNKEKMAEIQSEIAAIKAKGQVNA